MDFDLQKLVRPVVGLLPEPEQDRQLYTGVRLHANENSFGSPLTKWQNRYPEGFQHELKKKMGSIKNIAPQNIFFGNGRDECYDLLIRAFCEPGSDHILINLPHVGRVNLLAELNGVRQAAVSLTPAFQPDLDALSEAVANGPKIIFLSCPHDPSGSPVDHESVEILLNNFNGLVVLDEAYINFSRYRSFLPQLSEYPNLVIIQSMSFAWGLASLRLGMAFASEGIIRTLDKIKPPYSISGPVQELALKALDGLQQVNELTKATVAQRTWLLNQLVPIPSVQKVFPSEANFLLVRFEDAGKVQESLVKQGIHVYNCSGLLYCENCLRITVGTESENERLIQGLKNIL